MKSSRGLAGSKKNNGREVVLAGDVAVPDTNGNKVACPQIFFSLLSLDPKAKKYHFSSAQLKTKFFH